MHNVIRQLLRDDSSGDAWGDAMGAWFAIAGVLDIEGENVPAAWQYRPAVSVQTEAGLRADNDLAGWLLESFEAGEINATDLQHAGNVLDRYTTMLRNAGRDY